MQYSAYWPLRAHLCLQLLGHNRLFLFLGNISIVTGTLASALAIAITWLVAGTFLCGIAETDFCI